VANQEIKVAILVDKIVVNIFTMPGWEITQTWFEAGNFGHKPGEAEIAECPDYVKIGWIRLDDGGWSPPPEFQVNIPSGETNGAVEAIKAFLEEYGHGKN